MFGACGTPKKSCGESKPPPKQSQPKQGCGQSKGKVCRPGKVTRNAFFNYLRELRVKHCDWPVTKIAVEGAKCWCKMSCEAKKKYIDMARSAPKMHRRKRHHRERSSSCGRKGSHRNRSHGRRRG